jgi:hypothetical protein
VFTMSNDTKKTEDTLDDKALDQVAGGNSDGLGFLAGALIGGVVGGIAESVHPHGPNVVFAAPQQQFYPQQPTFVQAPPAYVQQPQVTYAPQQYAAPGFAPAPVVVNSGW